MTETQPSAVQTRVVGDGDDAIAFYVRGDLADATPERPALFLFGSPMDAPGFGTLAGHFGDRPVVTYDPRGSGANPTGTTDVTPEQHANDLHRVIEVLGVGPVDLFGTSGGGVNALALAAAHPEVIRRVVSHEPPTIALLPDRDQGLAAVADIKATYEAKGNGPAMAKFIALVMWDGELPADWTQRPAPDPASFGLSADDDGSRDNPLIRNMPACNEYEVNPDSFAALGGRVVIAVGRESGQTMAARAGRSVADRLGLLVTELPGGHTGFMGGEYGQQGEPDAFAAELRSLLA